MGNSNSQLYPWFSSEQKILFPLFEILFSTWQYAECQISGLKIHSTLTGKDSWGAGFETFEHEGKEIWMEELANL